MSQQEMEPLEPGTVVARNYRVLTRLGAGGMGTVYLAENLTLQQRVVVKVLRGGQAGAGHEEAQVLANLQHPNVVAVFAHDPQLDCIVMEFLDGAALSALLEKGVDRVNAIRIALSVAEALAAVHKRGLVHRDIKPENVMLTLNQGGGGRYVDWLKLIDFGTALKAGKVPQVLLGTPEYCPPEQFHPEAAHPANDVYALGVTIFLMMTGVFPFECERDDLPRQHHEVTPPGLLDKLLERIGREAFDPRTIALLEDLSELVAQMLAKRLQDRPSASEVARRLTRLESSFAEAGTVVAGTAASLSFIEPLVVPRRESGRSVLSKVLVPSTGEQRALSTSSTSPDVVPVMTTAEAHEELLARSEVRTSSAPDLASVATQLSMPALRRPSSAGRAAVALSQEPTTPAGRALPQTTVVDDDFPPPQRSNKGLIIALLVVVAVLGGALLFLDSLGAESQPKPPTVSQPAKPPPQPEPKVEPAPPADPQPVAAEPDAGRAPEPEPDAGVAEVVPAPAGKKPPRVEKGATCTFNDAFEQGARKTMNALLQGATAAQAERLEDLGDELYAAFKARDCRKTQVVLKKMSGVVRGK